MTRGVQVALIALALVAATVFGVREVGQVYREAATLRGDVQHLQQAVADRDDTITGYRTQIADRRAQQESIDAQSRAIDQQRASLDADAADLRRRVGIWLRDSAAACRAAGTAASPVPVPPAAASAQPAAPAGPVGGSPAPDDRAITVDVAAFADTCAAAAPAADRAEADLNRVIEQYNEVRGRYCARFPEGC